MKQESKSRPVRVGLISLGCAKNLVDAEIMVGTLMKDGIEITNDSADADVLIVNTCSFIDSAQEESVDTILESSGLRQTANPGQGIIVSGCLPQRFREELPRLLPEVDAFIGIDQVPQISGIVQEALARRAEKVKKSGAGAQGSPAKNARVVSRLAELDKNRGSIAHEEEAKIRGTDKFGNTRQVVTAQRARIKTPEAAPAPPLFDVTLRPRFIPDYATPRFRLTPRHFAYVKIAEGCNHPCSFCIIPRMRGSHRSRGQADVVAEAKSLLAQGVRELNLISQDSTYYGLDLRPDRNSAISAPDKFSAAVKSLPAQATTISTLLRELNALPGDFWVRLLYTHPAHWTDELIQTIAECPKVARYVDIPLQHIHETMLERMRRETSRQYIEELIGRIRAGIPGIALRTTFIVGFPGETESRFESLLEFIRTTRFERLGIFTYSQETGTRAGNMAGQIPQRTKQQRREKAMAVQHENAIHVSESFVGRKLKVLVEHEAGVKELTNAKISSWEHGLIRDGSAANSGLKGRYLVARGEADAPDIDGRVYIRGKLPLGDFARVKIVGHTDYDLIAEPA